MRMKKVRKKKKKKGKVKTKTKNMNQVKNNLKRKKVLMISQRETV